MIGRESGLLVLYVWLIFLHVLVRMPLVFNVYGPWLVGGCLWSRIGRPDSYLIGKLNYCQSIAASWKITCV